MSVLNQNSDDEPQECPLCMEYLELDDINFYPCSCGYQVSLEMKTTSITIPEPSVKSQKLKLFLIILTFIQKKISIFIFREKWIISVT